MRPQPYRVRINRFDSNQLICKDSLQIKAVKLVCGKLVMADEEKIKRMQSNLSVIRNVARWTTARLGEEVGVSRQTINSLEHGKTSMTKTQYLALRAVFNHEAMASENTALAQVIYSLVDEPVDEILVGADREQASKKDGISISAMDSLSATTTILADKEKVKTVAAALSSIAAPGLASLMIMPLLMYMKKRG